MAWERRDSRTYYYRSVRHGSRVRKIYCGTGLAGQRAAKDEAASRAKRQAEALAWVTEKIELDVVVALSEQAHAGCQLLAAAVLLASGLHSPARHTWRTWYVAKRAIRNAAKGTNCEAVPSS